MRILMIHNLYKEEGGENLVFRTESELLSKQGHDVERLVFDNSTIKTFVDRCLAGLRAIYNPESERIVKRSIANFRPDIIHIHNFLPLASPSVFFAAKKCEVPVVVTLHNYRLI